MGESNDQITNPKFQIKSDNQLSKFQTDYHMTLFELLVLDHSLLDIECSSPILLPSGGFSLFQEEHLPVFRVCSNFYPAEIDS
jgi:hypothetical protein